MGRARSARFRGTRDDERSGRLIIGLTLALLLLASCKGEPKTAEKPAAPTAGAKPYTLAATAEASALVTQLTVAEGYKVNPDYPTSFRPEGSSAGVRFAEERFIVKDSAEATPCAGHAEATCALRAKVPFTVTSTGPQRAAGVFAFSVCNPDGCLIEKVPVSAEIR